MKLRKLVKVTKMLVLSMIVSLALQTAVPVLSSNELTVQAATKTVKLNTTKKTLTVGKTYQLKLTGTTKKITWSSSKKSVAKVSSKGKVTAIAAGTATITAKVDNKKYTCKITVKAPQDTYIASAPFEAKEIDLGKYTAVIPKSWETLDLSSMAEEGESWVILYPADTDMTQEFSMIYVMTTKGTVQDGIDYAKVFESKDVEKAFKELLETSLNEDQSIKDLSAKAIKKNTKEYLECKFTLETEGIKSISMDMYFYMNDGYVTLITEAVYTNVNSLSEVTDYILTSLTLKK